MAKSRNEGDVEIEAVEEDTAQTPLLHLNNGEISPYTKATDREGGTSERKGESYGI